ncbi:hypothetical protein KKP04_13870 [Rhodomicrobium sp. Az07]|nr:hypothetical protein [Rhodomicrobium sp. Az07]MBT3071950.1 hypothetical protein [Rhodomicrobium sp. Az07]
MIALRTFALVGGVLSFASIGAHLIKAKADKPTQSAKRKAAPSFLRC